MTKERCEAPELGAMCARMFRALARRAADGELEAIEELAKLQKTAGIQLAVAVTNYREFQPAAPSAPRFSWTDVGRVLGITRQAAQQRFGG